MLKLTMMLATAGALLTALPPTKAIVVPQTNAPIEITKYETKYRTSGVLSLSNGEKDGIWHELEFANRSDKAIVAVQFGVISFDAYDQYYDGFLGSKVTTLSVKDKAKKSWHRRGPEEDTFTTGVVWVNAVRYSDDHVWTADSTEVLAALRKLQSTFDYHRIETLRRDTTSLAVAPSAGARSVLLASR